MSQNYKEKIDALRFLVGDPGIAEEHGHDTLNLCIFCIVFDSF